MTGCLHFSPFEYSPAPNTDKGWSQVCIDLGFPFWFDVRLDNNNLQNVIRQIETHQRENDVWFAWSAFMIEVWTQPTFRFHAESIENLIWLRLLVEP